MGTISYQARRLGGGRGRRDAPHDNFDKVREEGKAALCVKEPEPFKLLS